MGGLKTLLTAALGGSILIGACAQMPSAQEASEEAFQKVSPKLVEYQERYEPALVQASPRVHAAFAYDYANYGYIEGDDGVIVVDTGWFPDQARRSMADYRALTDKPVVAVIYTHLHPDHYGGASGLLAEEDFDGPIYGPEGWDRWFRESFSSIRPELYRRIYAQMGMLLPEGEDGTVGSGVGPRPAIGGTPAFSHQPNVAIGEHTILNISGVEIHLIPTPGDLNEHLYIWLPNEKVLFAGDVIAGTFPAIETVRFEAGRDPALQISAYQRALDLEPDFIIGGHGRLLTSAEDVREVIGAWRDVTQFMVDQLDRAYINGLSADDVIDTLKLPPALADHPDLQLHYHRLEWMIKTMHLKRAGFIGEAMDYVTLTNSEEAERLVPLMGGRDAVFDAAEDALADEPRWSARLATYLLEVDESDEAARALRQSAFQRIAGTTISANERNYLLTIIKEERGEIDWEALFSGPDLQIIETLDTETVLDLMRARFRAEAADEDAFSIALTVSGEAAPH
ncbi:MAG: MBL fold metallo-hydrolase, partial [Pseudomonadota bacterium]